jgi:ABC-type lipoprotein release transport system permease subunit
MVDPNIYAGAIILAIGNILGAFLGVVVPFAIKSLQRQASLAQLNLDAKRHAAKLVQSQGKQLSTGPIAVQPPVLQPGTAGGLP